MLDGRLRLAESGQDPHHRGGIGSVTRTRLGLYEFTSTREERAPVV
jgi:hypothetical protein